ncbi:hypothetical protein DFH06DRAFT_1173959 [Mycena polygramma]|nr:hypothetical protein DFH06DRAFT_1173959 [Mycena polygramma]
MRARMGHWRTSKSSLLLLRARQMCGEDTMALTVSIRSPTFSVGIAWPLVAASKGSVSMIQCLPAAPSASNPQRGAPRSIFYFEAG